MTLITLAILASGLASGLALSIPAIRAKRAIWG